MKILLRGLLFLLFLGGCSQKESPEIAHSGQQLDQPEESSKNKLREVKLSSLEEIHFEKINSYGSTEDVLIGEISAVTADGKNRVYIADSDQTTIHVFAPGGKYITSLGREGQGPAEFSAAGFYKVILNIHSDRLYATDTAGFFPHRIHLYDLDELSFSHSIPLDASNKKNYEDDLKGYFVERIYPRNDDMLLVAYRRMPNEYRDSTSFIRYVTQDSTGRIESAPIFEQKDEINLTYEVTDTQIPYTAIHSFPFFEKSLITTSENDQIYSANTKRFEIDVYNRDGKHIRFFQHSFENITFDKTDVIQQYEQTGYMSQLGEKVALNMIREADNLPETWPALNKMFFDDENRLWISTIVEDFDIYEWWILETTGEVITKFEWPRDEPIEVIKNGYMYTRNTEESTGLQTIVKYRVEMNS